MLHWSLLSNISICLSWGRCPCCFWLTFGGTVLQSKGNLMQERTVRPPSKSPTNRPDFPVELALRHPQNMKVQPGRRNVIIFKHKQLMLKQNPTRNVYSLRILRTQTVVFFKCAFGGMTSLARLLRTSPRRWIGGISFLPKSRNHEWLEQVRLWGWDHTANTHVSKWPYVLPLHKPLFGV